MTRAETLLHRQIAEADGAIPFEHFMATALYHPELGYYSRKIRQVGRHGDFATSATLSSALGETIAHWAMAERDALGWTGEWHLIEIGGGSGELAAAVLEAFGWWKRRAVHFHIVEISDPLRMLQKERLGTTVRWHHDVVSALVEVEGRAIIFSNELVDAFPCRLVEKYEAEWAEVYVSSTGQSFEETLYQIPQEEIPESLHALDRPPGQRCEIHRTYRDWLHKCGAALAHGSLLTIDYGGTPAEIYHRHPRGTIRGFAHQMRFEGHEIYERLGRQDLTADVNFSALSAWGAEAGFDDVSLHTQRAFLQKYMPDFRHRVDSDRTLDFLTDPLGAGESFKVLHQRKGAPAKSQRSKRRAPSSES